MAMVCCFKSFCRVLLTQEICSKNNKIFVKGGATQREEGGGGQVKFYPYKRVGVRVGYQKFRTHDLSIL